MLLIAVLDWMRYSLTSLPFLSAARREALILAPLPYSGKGWGVRFFGCTSHE